MAVKKPDLKSFIVENELAPAEAVKAAAKEARDDDHRLAQILLERGIINNDALQRIKSYILGIPFISLEKVKIPPEIITYIPEPIARRHNIVAFNKSERGLEVAMLDPADVVATDFIRKSTGLKVLPRLTDVTSIKRALVQYQKSLKDEFSDIIEKESAAIAPVPTEGEMTEKDLKKIAADLPVVRIVDTLLSHAFVQKASDIHLEPYEKEFIIRYRIDGLLHDAMTLPRAAAAGIVARIKVLSALRLDEKRLPQDGRFKYQMKDGEAVSLRVSILPTYYGEKVVMRLLPDTVHGLSLEDLGFHGEGLERLHKATRSTTGMILATGPTGSGKTTTLYSLLNILNTPDVNISTIEDPIEYQIPRLTQTQVKPDIGLTFGNGLRALVRQDPDIIMVGEIRDKETIGLAVNASLTGHLVLSTIHTNSAAGAIPRMLDMGVEPFLLTSTINVIIGQRLVRRLAGQTEAYVLPAAELKNLAATVDLDQVLKVLREEKRVPTNATWETINFYRPKPSVEAIDGYEGRIGIHEVLWVSSAIKAIIMKPQVDSAEIEAQAKKEGMLSMLEDGIYKAALGVTTIEEVLRVINE